MSKLKKDSPLETWSIEDFSYWITYRQTGIHTDVLWGATPWRWQPIKRSTFRHMRISPTICFEIQYQSEQGIWIDKLSVPALSVNAFGSWRGTRVSISLKKKNSCWYWCPARSFSIKRTLSALHYRSNFPNVIQFKFLDMTNKFYFSLSSSNAIWWIIVIKTCFSIESNCVVKYN